MPTRTWNQPKLPGIDHAPAILRAHGLREAHTHPLVSSGRNAAGQFDRLRRVPAAQAWPWSEVEFRTPNSHPVIILDIDRGTAMEDLAGLALDERIPWPNWTTENTANGHVHAAWTLARPVLRGPKARRHPLALAARCSEYLACTLDADRGYSGPTAHNPTHDRYRTSWPERTPYSLVDLARWIPKGWTLPQAPRTELGRNSRLFLAGCQWAAAAHRLGRPVLDHLMQLNAAEDPPLDYLELRGIARSVERYRLEWQARGWHLPAWIERQRNRGKRSGQARRIKTADRDRLIVDLHRQGHSQPMIAQEVGMTQQGVGRVLKRRDETAHEQAPGTHARLTLAAVHRLHRHGRSERQLAELMQLSRRQIRRILAGPDPLDRPTTEPTQDDPGKRSESGQFPERENEAVFVPDSQDPDPTRADRTGRGKGERVTGREGPTDPALAALALAADRKRRQLQLTLD